MEIKRKFYILSFTVLGLAIGLFVAEVVQLVYLHLLISDFVTYSFGMNWTELGEFYYFFSAMLVLFCALWGYFAGKFWWNQIYVLHKYDKRWKHLIKKS